MIALPVRLYGMGSDGKPFVQDARTVDVTRDGARVAGVPQINAVGEVVGVQYGNEKARFKVVWVGQAGSEKDGQIGIQIVEQGKTIWAEVLEATPEEFRWTDLGRDRDRSIKPSSEATAAVPSPSDVSARVEWATHELKLIEQMIQSGAVDPRILREFREAVNHVRQTSWAVEKWLELQEQKLDPYDAINIIVSERIRCAIQLTHDLISDIESSEISFETQGVDKLQNEIDTLSRVLARILGKEKL